MSLTGDLHHLAHELAAMAVEIHNEADNRDYVLLLEHGQEVVVIARSICELAADAKQNGMTA